MYTVIINLMMMTIQFLDQFFGTTHQFIESPIISHTVVYNFNRISNVDISRNYLEHNISNSLVVSAKPAKHKHQE